MDYLNDLAAQYYALASVLGSLFGIAGVIFGFWRYHREQTARIHLKNRQTELDEARARLKNLESYAAGLRQYSATV